MNPIYDYSSDQIVLTAHELFNRHGPGAYRNVQGLYPHPDIAVGYINVMANSNEIEVSLYDRDM